MLPVSAKLPPSSALPLSAEEFAICMSSLAVPNGAPLAMAISGGPDSMALAYLLQRWASANGTICRALIVDHALRPGSAAEAIITRERLAAQGITADVLTWAHQPLTARIHVTARKARYELLAQACRQLGIDYLVTAHQREDQAETILMRLAKGSGVDGLAGIAATSRQHDITILRPLLSLPKERLAATCDATGIHYLVDPSNTAARFARGRLRQVMPLLSAEGLTIDRLFDLGRRAAMAKQALDHYADQLVATASWMDIAGTIRFKTLVLQEAPREIAARCLSRALQAIHPQDYAPEQQGLDRLMELLLNNRAERPGSSLHGCLITRQQKTIQIQRETGAITEQLPISTGETVLWDARFYVNLKSQPEKTSFIIKSLGLRPHARLDHLASGLRHTIPQGRVRAALPALWENNRLVAIPSLSIADPAALATAYVAKNWPIIR